VLEHRIRVASSMPARRVSRARGVVLRPDVAPATASVGADERRGVARGACPPGTTALCPKRGVKV
jgi:hypothetical protein